MHDVQTLVLDGNALSDWRSLRPLYHTSNLKCLSLSDNHIDSVPAEELSEGGFPTAAYNSALCITYTCLGNCAKHAPPGIIGTRISQPNMFLCSQ